MLGKRLRELRGKKIQQEIADLLEISRGRYSHYENEHVQPDNEMLQKMADLHKVTVDYLLGRTDKPNQVLAEPVRRLIDSLDLSDEEIYNTVRMEVDGMVLEKDDVIRFVAFVRAERAMRKQVPVAEQNNK